MFIFVFSFRKKLCIYYVELDEKGSYYVELDEKGSYYVELDSSLLIGIHIVARRFEAVIGSTIWHLVCHANEDHHSYVFVSTWLHITVVHLIFCVLWIEMYLAWMKKHWILYMTRYRIDGWCKNLTRMPLFYVEKEEGLHYFWEQRNGLIS